MISFFKRDITEVEAEVIVNAANGIGFMGGWIGKKIKSSGVAESIHYHTKGVVEKEARKAIKKKLSKVGGLYITSAANLKADYIFHAVTMFLPGTISNIYIVEKCIISIIDKAKEMGIKSIAIPALGTGTGKVNKRKVAEIYIKHFEENSDIEWIIVDPKGDFIDVFKKNNLEQ